jgi:hypothetical protein
MGTSGESQHISKSNNLLIVFGQILSRYKRQVKNIGKPINVLIGVWQGCILSSMLSSLTLDDVTQAYWHFSMASSNRLITRLINIVTSSVFMARWVAICSEIGWSLFCLGSVLVIGVYNNIPWRVNRDFVIWIVCFNPVDHVILFLFLLEWILYFTFKNITV